MARVLIALVLLLTRQAFSADPSPPNIVFILCDNLGYGDIGCFGSKVHRTPNVDRLAAEGIKLTHFYAASGVCTPSRASLMTGCYPRRVNLHENARGGKVLQPVESIGLHPDEITLAELLKSRGYATKLIGKWHLGDQPEFLPTRQGFDEYLGIPYSDDMTPRPGERWPPLPLLREERVIEAPVDRNELTRRYTDEAIGFIRAHQERPFFLLLSHAMPGSTLTPFASEKFRGKSANGLYGDAVEEIDWSTGQLLASLKELQLEERTLVIWTSDNGAPRRTPPQGSNLPLGGWGYTTSEGGMRVPCIARWPKQIPAATTCSELATMMDWFPTFANLSGAALPADRPIDGRDLRPMLSGAEGAKSPHEAFYYYDGRELAAVRSGPWKLYLAGRSARESKRVNTPQNAARLVDVVVDPGELHDRSAEHADVVQRLTKLADRAREDLGDGSRAGSGQRPNGQITNPQPLLLQ
jgi:arylsulfatase A